MEHVDDAGERVKRQIGRPSTVTNFRKQVVESVMAIFQQLTLGSDIEPVRHHLHRISMFPMRCAFSSSRRRINCVNLADVAMVAAGK